jgi:uncharacterized protein involved in exopolysaccharide biosynthesis
LIATTRGAKSELEWDAAKVRKEIATTKQELEIIEQVKRDHPEALPSYLAMKDDELKALLRLRSEKERRVAALKQNYTAEHPEVRTSQAELDSTAKAISDRVEGMLIGYRARLEALRSALGYLEKQSEQP